MCLFQALFVPNSEQRPTYQYLYLEIDRTNIVEDTLILIRQLEAHELRKPLKVHLKKNFQSHDKELILELTLYAMIRLGLVKIRLCWCLRQIFVSFGFWGKQNFSTHFLFRWNFVEKRQRTLVASPKSFFYSSWGTYLIPSTACLRSSRKPRQFGNYIYEQFWIRVLSSCGLSINGRIHLFTLSNPFGRVLTSQHPRSLHKDVVINGWPFNECF